MKNTTPYADFPDALRELIEAELKAGNQIVELSSTFPAPPAGAYVKLENPVTTRPRESSEGVSFYDRNSSSYSGEFTDAKRFYFVLEPPRPPEPEPDMDAIRAEMEARQAAADAQLYADQAANYNSPREDPGELPERRAVALPSPIPAVHKVETAVDRFRESMVCTYDRWREGTGYDVGIFKMASPEELVEIETLLLSRGIDDWRDVEALASLDSPRAKVALRKALKSSHHRVRLAVAEYAPGLVSEAERIAILADALEGSDTYGGLTQALLEIEAFHPPEIIDALLRGVLNRSGGPPVHFAAMLMFLHGKASSAFDWNHRPFFLKFNTDDLGERIRLFRELCGKIGVDAKKYLP